MNVCFDGMRRNSVKSADRLVRFLESKKHDGVVTFAVDEESIDIINEAYQNLRQFCLVKGTIEDFMELSDPRWFDDEE